MGANKGRPVAIVGGGIGGLTAALAFARTGALVTVYEQARALTEVGAGLQITPNGAVVLRALGLDDAMSLRGISAGAVVPTDAISGKPIARFDLSGRDYSFFHRADLIEMLAQACAEAGVQIILGQRCDAPLDDVALTVGADGIRSSLRDILNGPQTPFFTGQVAWRAMITADHPSEARIWMAPGRHLVTYPLSRGRLNIVAVQERTAFAAEGWNHPDDPANLRSAFADSCMEIQDILSKVEDVNLWGLYRNPVADRWHNDSLALIGDAAHPTLPFLAQGANLAIEDAFVLARACDGDASLVRALDVYQTLRRDRVVRAIDAANANAVNYHLSGIKRRVAHLGLQGLGRIAPNAFLNRLSWLYDHDVTL